MKILTYSFPGAKITTRYDSKYPRHVIRPKDHEIEPISATSAANRSPTPAGATINVASRSPLPPSSPAMEQAACRTPIVRKGMAQIGQRERKKEREREGGRIGRRDTNLYSCKIKSHRRSARLGETDQPGRPMQLICIKNRLFRPISCSATLAGTGQSGWLSFN